MDKIGIIGAMNEEIKILKNNMQISNSIKIAQMEFYEGILNGKNIIVVESGIGKVNAAACTQILITYFEVEVIINTGVAGAIYDKLDIGDIVVSTDVIHHDFDVTTFGYKLGQIPRIDTYTFSADSNLVKITERISKEELLKHNVYTGRILSGDKFIASSEEKNKLWNIFNGYCAEMEGAAIGQICYLNNVPFVILRAISDKADGSADVNYNEFVHEAATNSSDIVEKIISYL